MQSQRRSLSLIPSAFRHSIVRGLPSSRRSWSWTWGYAAALLCGGGAQAQAFFDSGPVSFTASQAARGKIAYDRNCGSCHGGRLDGGQFAHAIKGGAFEARWSSQSPGALLSLIKTTMPPANPGNLAGQTYADIEAYILEVNGAAAGSTELTAAQSSSQAVTDGTPPPSATGGAQRADSGPRTAQRPTSGPEWGKDATYQAAMARRRALLDGTAPVTDDMLRHPADSDWLVWRGTDDSLGYSALRQINRSNVRDLRAIWSLSLPVSSNETTPLMHDGVLFVESADTVEALDASSGDLLWQYIRELPEGLHRGHDARMKNLAIYQSMLYAPTPDGHIVALDVKSGKLLWDQEVITATQRMHEGEVDGEALHISGGPLVAHGKVIVGVSLGVHTGGGDYIVGLDARSGAEVWRFHTIERVPPGDDSWNGAPVGERYGSGVWNAGSYDPDLNLVYFGTGNTYDIGTLLQPRSQGRRSNDALYTDSTLALDPDTGRLAWYYQHMNRDVWDLDWAFEQLLITLPIDGKPVKLVVTGGKLAIFDAVNRVDGRYKFSEDLGVQDLVATVDPKTGRKVIERSSEPLANKSALVCPSALGARNWPATSLDPRTDILYVPLLRNFCMNFAWVPRDAAAVAGGGQDGHVDIAIKPGADGNWGAIEAVDLKTRKILWTLRQRSAVASSMLATAGDVVFSGARDLGFRAFDAASGKLLWQTRLDASPSSSPMTYSVGGRQYIAIVTGGGGPLNSITGLLTPEVYTPPPSTTLWVFSLPEAGDEASH